MTPLAKARLVKRIAREVGFDLVGITHAGPVERTDYYRQWLAAGYGGSMEYLKCDERFRARPDRLLRGARSVICVALNYRRAPVSAPDPGWPLGHVAAYARGRDYHVVLRRMLCELTDRVRERLRGPIEFRVCVDTAPVLERELARAAGLGWIGRNTCLLSEELGSYLFLGEAITTIELAPDEPAPDRCGRCTRCLEACPSKAFPAPYQLDASRCVSYLTIEHRGEVPEGFHASIGAWVFGCDVCQDVCPYNQRAPLATHADATADCTPADVNLLELVNLGSAAYRRLTRGSASARARRSMWRRNAAIALGNAGNLDGPLAAEVNRALTVAAEDDDPAVRHAATCGLRRGGRD